MQVLPLPLLRKSRKIDLFDTQVIDLKGKFYIIIRDTKFIFFQ